MKLETFSVRNWLNNFTMINYSNLFTLRCQILGGPLFKRSSFPHGQPFPAHFCLAHMYILHRMCPPLETPPLLLHTSR